MTMMEDIRQRYWAEPFEPFVLKLDSGRQVPVYGRDCIAFNPEGGEEVAVVQPDSSFEFIDLLRILEIEKAPGLAA